MDLGSFTKEELTLAAAMVAAIGATIAAFISLFSSSRSKYIDTVTTARIAWVRELRGDFAKLLGSFTKLITAEANGLSEDAKYALEVEVTDLVILTNMKLNRRSSLDREISKLLQAVLKSVKEGDGKEDYGRFAGRLSVVVEELLKEEWEKAKSEASGPIRQIPIWWRKIGREDARKQRRKRWQKADSAPPVDTNTD
jgi:hypothetical protein